MAAVAAKAVSGVATLYIFSEYLLSLCVYRHMPQHWPHPPLPLHHRRSKYRLQTPR